MEAWGKKREYFTLGQGTRGRKLNHIKYVPDVREVTHVYFAFYTHGMVH